jgi:hypothetical protein
MMCEGPWIQEKTTSLKKRGTSKSAAGKTKLPSERASGSEDAMAETLDSVIDDTL